jgi:hypothetical protein
VGWDRDPLVPWFGGLKDDVASNLMNATGSPAPAEHIG